MGTEDKVEVGVQHIDIRRDLPVFSGEKGERLDEWLDGIESYLNSIHYPQSHRSGFLMEHIEGVARRELRCEWLTWKNTWAELVELLEQYFGQPKPTIPATFSMSPTTPYTPSTIPAILSMSPSTPVNPALLPTTPVTYLTSPLTPVTPAFIPTTPVNRSTSPSTTVTPAFIPTTPMTSGMPSPKYTMHVLPPPWPPPTRFRHIIFIIIISLLYNHNYLIS